MQRRVLYSLINIGVAIAAIVVLFAFPRYAGYAVYGFLGWFAVSLVAVWFARGAPHAAVPAGPTTPAPGPAPSAAPATSRPLPSAARSAPPTAGAAAPAIGFCVYCGQNLPPEARRCPVCGRARSAS